MKKLVWLAVYVLIWSPLFSQQEPGAGKRSRKKESPEEILPWSEGSVLLTDDTELKGEVRYDDRNGVLSFRDGNDSQALTERRVVTFDFYDQRLERQRRFITLPYEETPGAGHYYFFEVLKELKTFAVLAKADPMAVKTHNTPSGPNNTPGGSVTVVMHLETVYIMDKDGEIRPFFENSIRHDNKTLKRTEDENSMGSDLRPAALIECIGQNRYTLLRKYAKENKLSFERKEDLMKIMNYYVLQLEPSDD
jgi:hypothetical protein